MTNLSVVADAAKDQVRDPSRWLGEAFNQTQGGSPQKVFVRCDTFADVMSAVSAMVCDFGQTWSVTIWEPEQEGGDVAWHGTVFAGDDL
jgi:hypothetical protein